MVLEGQVPTRNTRRQVLTKAQLFFGIEKRHRQSADRCGRAAAAVEGQALDVFSSLRGLPVFELVLADGDRRRSQDGSARTARTARSLHGFPPTWLMASNSKTGLKSMPRLQAALRRGDPSVLLNETIEFATGSAEVPEAARARLNLIAQVLAEDGRSVKVLGHYRQRRRCGVQPRAVPPAAESVAAYLVAHGVDAGKLTADGAGQDKPVADNGTPGDASAIDASSSSNSSGAWQCSKQGAFTPCCIWRHSRPRPRCRIGLANRVRQSIALLAANCPGAS